MVPGLCVGRPLAGAFSFPPHAGQRDRARAPKPGQDLTEARAVQPGGRRAYTWETEKR